MKEEAIYIVSLEQANRSQAQLIGSKGANLGELLRLGLRVPAGFCVTTSAYDYFLTNSGIANDLAQLSLEARKDPGVASNWARELILKSQIQGKLKLEIEHHYRLLGARLGPDHDIGFAVRSSALDEDSTSDSFAGIHDSYLNVIGLDALLARLQDCWASFWSERALIYRQIHGLLNEKIRGAVVVQEMLKGQAAGVLFTADPASGDRSSLLIEAHGGPGEDLVSGAVTPQRYTLNRSPLRIASKYPCEVDFPDRQLAPSRLADHDPVLTDAELLELSQSGITIENLYGSSQDIEWAHSSDGFYFLQTRPITTLSTNHTWPDPNIWTRKSINERFPEPLKALESSFVADCVFTPGFRHLFNSLGVQDSTGSEVFRSFAGIAYLNKRVIAHCLQGVPEQAAMQILERSTERPTVPFTLTLVFTIAKLLNMLLFTHRRFDRAVPGFIRSCNNFRQHSLEEMSLAELVTELHAIADEIKEISSGHMQSVLIAELLFEALRNLGSDINSLMPALTRGNQANKSVEMSERLSQLVSMARKSELVGKIIFLDDPASAFALLQIEPKARPFYCCLRSFLQDFGHRSAMYQLSYPRWAEEPSQVIQLIQNELRLAPGHHHRCMSDAELSRLQAVAERQINGSRASRFGKKLWFRFLLKYSQIYSGVLRENEGFYITMMFPEVKRVLRSIANELKQLSVLEQQDDIYHLTFSEVCELADGIPDPSAITTIIARRKREFLRSTSPEDRPEQEPSGNLANGAPASPGNASGPAVVLSHPADRFIPGAILVTRTLNSSWCSALRFAAGVVTEVGGMLSHGAVLAREFGVPAVLGIGPIARHIRTGQQISVDGSRGHVYIDDDSHLHSTSLQYGNLRSDGTADECQTEI